MKGQALNDYLTNIRKPHQEKKNKATPILQQYRDMLLAEYQKIEQTALQDYTDRHNALLLRKKAFDDKTCQHCHQKLRLVQTEYRAFYGCPAYRDGEDHSSFPINYEEQFHEQLHWVKIRINMDWLTNILKTTGLKGRVRASDLLDFLQEQGYDDLRDKYGLSSTQRLITNLVRTKQASTREEKEIATFLKAFFVNNVQQQGIRYKLQTEQETIAIIDLIVSNDKTVYLLEIKRHPHNIHEYQLSLYQSLLQHIMDQAADPRRIQPVFLVYNTPEYPVPFLAGSYVLYDEIKPLKDAAAIISKFDHISERKSYKYRLINPYDYWRQ